ncbi:MAG: hypothetical protein ABSE41_07225 [Bacteroidota bacterium]|jgi:hypothetical protein
MKSNTKPRLFFLLVLLLVTSPLCRGQQDVPEKYKSLYEQYKSGLEKYNAYLDRADRKSKSTVCFGAELLAANGNRGEDLLSPRALKGVELSLDRFVELGIQGATIAIGYPILTDDLPRSDEYLAFYKKVAEMVRSRHMKLCVKLHVLFAGTVYSSLKVDFSLLTVEKLTAGKRLMAERVIGELAPDYLTLGGEPDTEAKLSGLKALNDPVAYSGMVQSILKDLKRGNTLVGVGQGTWITPDFAKAYAKTDVDFINIHIYPFGKRVLEVLNQICATAREGKKRLILDECWLYKVAPGEGLGVAASAAIYRRDAYGFWEPVDKLFLESMAKVCQPEQYRVCLPLLEPLFLRLVEV